MEWMIHVLKVTATESNADAVAADTRHSMIVFVKCPDAGSAYAPADAHLRQTGWANIELVDCRAVPPEAVEKLDESLQNAYREADKHRVAAVLLKSS
jgi:hypothetical protein